MWTAINSDSAVAAANDNHLDLLRQNRTRFPAGTVARIVRRTRSPLRAGRADTRCWRLTFNSRGRRCVEPVMGWTGSTDPLAGLELRFPTLEAAIGYARRQGLEFVVHGAARRAVPAPALGLADQKSAPAVVDKRAA